MSGESYATSLPVRGYEPPFAGIPFGGARGVKLMFQRARRLPYPVVRFFETVEEVIEVEPFNKNQKRVPKKKPMDRHQKNARGPNNQVLHNHRVCPEFKSKAQRKRNVPISKKQDD